MIVITAPERKLNLIARTDFKLFLAGGITGVSNWQSEIIKLLKEDEQETSSELIAFNPRRENFPIDDPDAASEQIEWEYDHLQISDSILFWFAKGTDNPIVLYELGKWGTSSGKPIFIGIEDGYSRKDDVIIQTKLARPDIKICYTLDELSNAVKDYLSKK